MPDLPGMGGMDSFYKIGKKPTLDNFADYLAAYIKLRYKRRRVIIVGMSFGFVIATRMFQRYPELAKRVDLLVSFAGFAHRNDFAFPKWEWLSYRAIAKTLTHRLPAAFFRNICLHPKLIRAAYKFSNNAKFKGIIGDELEEISKFEISLWHNNDVRTWGYTLAEFLKLDNTAVHVDMPVHHIAVKGDHYFNNYRVEQHFRVIFSDFVLLQELDLANHAPSVIADEKAASVFVPPKLRRILQRDV
jgi:pimeloyl-ACP methyl ester carboxylesterase